MVSKAETERCRCPGVFGLSFLIAMILLQVGAYVLIIGDELCALVLAVSF
jgi:hypothetical protein